MESILLHVYLVGAGVATALFAVAFSVRFMYRSDPEMNRICRELTSWLLSIAALYILFWPWRCVGFPIYTYVQVKRGRREAPNP